jgi:FKBP-type peptidyl-prolyl cis-trans isomerase
MIRILGRSFAARAAFASFALTISTGIAISMILAPGSVWAQGSAETDDEKAFYAIGASLASQIEMLKPMSERELDLLFEGMRAGVNERVQTADPAENRTRIRNLIQAREEASLVLEKDAAAAFLATEAKRKGARTTESGLIITEIKAGKGGAPSATDKVKVHYHGTLRDGTVFDSSVERGTPAEFPLNRVIPCWTEGVTMMKVGGKARLVCPAEIAYGDRRSGSGRIPPGSALSFEVELIEIVR